MSAQTQARVSNSAETNEESSPSRNFTRNIKRSTRDVYYSDIVGEYIKDAITGAAQPWRVGSTDEDKFFRVIVTTNPPSSSRKGAINNTISREAHKAFYDTPIAYMKHNNCMLEDAFVKEWYETQNVKNPELFEE